MNSLRSKLSNENWFNSKIKLSECWISIITSPLESIMTLVLKRVATLFDALSLTPITTWQLFSFAALHKISISGPGTLILFWTKRSNNGLPLTGLVIRAQ